MGTEKPLTIPYANQIEESELEADEAGCSSILEEELCEIEDSGVIDELIKDESESELLDKAKEIELFEKIKKGGEDAAKAIAEIFEENQKLVRSIVRKYRWPNGWFTKKELMLVCNLELLEAMLSFDPKSPCKFSTYAYKCLRGRIEDTQRKDPRRLRPNKGTGEEYEGLVDLYMRGKGYEPLTAADLLAFARENNIKRQDGTEWTEETLATAMRSCAQFRFFSSIEAPKPTSDADDENGEGIEIPETQQDELEEPSVSGDSETAQEVVKMIAAIIETNENLNSDEKKLLKELLDDPFMLSSVKSSLKLKKREKAKLEKIPTALKKLRPSLEEAGLLD